MAIAGKLKDRYEIREILAKGGMGVVYIGFDSVMKRQVAIKTLLDMTDENALHLFQKECEDLASMTHPNIIEIYDVGQFQEDDVLRPYLVMPLLRGETLDKLIRSSSPRLTVERSVDMICQACRGLQAAHERGLVHRDIKPSNLFVMEDDSVKIIDFGVAHRTETSRTMGRKGTLLYMSPEQLALKPLSPASDIFSLAVVCYETLTKRKPFDRGTESSVAEAILHFLPPPVSELNPEVNRALSQAIHKGMAKQTWHRYSSAREFGETLQKALRNEAIEIFSPARIRPRLQRAADALERGDHQFASEIVGELEAEGHLETAIIDLRGKIDVGIKRKTTTHLLETARTRIEGEEYQLAMQKVHEVLQMDPSHADALGLKTRIEKERTEREVAGHFERATAHLEASAFSQARAALQAILQLRPTEVRALRMLTEVDRLEKERAGLRQENEQAYQSAVEAVQRGDLSSALTKLQRVLELDRTAPEGTSAERATMHHSFYDNVRAEQERVETAYAEAKRKMESKDFSGALSICQAQLAKYPEHALFQALKIDVEERQRLDLSATVAETQRRVEAESDLDRRVALLEAALRSNPGERHLEQLLQRNREKQRLVESIINKARSQEQEGQFTEALSQWEMLQTIHPQYEGLSAEVDRVVRAREQHQQSAAKNKWVQQVDRLLENRDYAPALELIAQARRDGSDGGELDRLETMARSGLQKAAEAGQLMSMAERQAREGRHEESLATIEKAYAVDDRNPAVRAALLGTLLERAKPIIDSKPDDAARWLRRAIEIDPANSQAKGLLKAVDERGRKQYVDECLSQVRRLESQGDLPAVARLLDDALAKFPDEVRLLRLRESLKSALEPAKPAEPEPVKPIETVKAAEPVKPVEPVKPIEPEPVRAVSGFETEIRLDAFTGEFEIPRKEPVAAPPPAPVAAAAPKPVPPAPAPAQRPPESAKPALAALLAQPKILGGIAAGVAAIVVIAAVVHFASGRKPAIVTPPPAQQAFLEITTSPPGALVLVDGKESGTSSSALQLPLSPGSVQIEARLPGFQTARATANLQSGARMPVTLTLTPILALKLQLPGDGQVTVNNEPPATASGGEFSRELTPGTYSVKITSGRSGVLNFAFQVDGGGPAVLTGPPNAQDVTALLISNFGDQGRIYTTGSPVKIQLDGQPLGELNKSGLDLPRMSAGTHELALGEGQEQRKKSADFGPARTLTAIIDSDPNTGALVVQTNEDGVAITVLDRGKEVARGQTKGKRYYLPNLRAKTYTVRAAKDGYDADSAEQPAEIQKGQDKTVAFAFRKKPQTGFAHIRLTPGSELFADGSPIPAAPGEVYTVRDLKPGSHTFRAQKGKQFLPSQKTVDIAEGQTSEVDLRLTAAPVPVEIKRVPPDSTVTYTRAGDPTVRTFVGSRQELAEGDYTFTARAKGYLETVQQQIHISWDFVGPLDLTESPIKQVTSQSFTIADWGKGVWTQTPGWYTKKGGGIQFFPRPLGTGLVQFTIYWQGKGHALWILNASDNSNYLQCELDEEGFQIYRVTGGKKPAAIGKKKAISKMDSYTIRIEVKPDGITHKLQKDGNWETIDTLAETAPPGGKFGFNILNGQSLFLANFTLQADH